MHTGCQWYNLPVAKDSSGNPEIHHTTVFKTFRFWVNKGCFDEIFETTVMKLFKNMMLDTSVLHGDGTSTAAKKGGII